MATCIVTGGAGFLGSHMCDHLLSAGQRVICFDNLGNPMPHRFFNTFTNAG